MDRNNLNRIRGILSAKYGAEIPKFTPGGVIKVTDVVYKDGRYFLNGQHEVDAKTGLWYFDLVETARAAAQIGGNTEIGYPEYKLSTSNKMETPAYGSDGDILKGEKVTQYTVNGLVVSKELLDEAQEQANKKIEEFKTRTGLGNKINETKVDVSTQKTEPADLQPSNILNVLKDGINNSLNDLNGTKLNTTIIGGTNTDPNGAVKDAAEIQNLINDSVLLLEVQVTANNLQEKRQVASLNTDSSGILLPITRQLTDTPLLTKRDIRQHNRALLKEQKQFDREYNKTSKDFDWSLVGLSLSLGIQVIGGAMGALQAASDSDTTKNITAAWDGAANIASQFGPVGEAVGAVMGIAKATGDIIQGITGGTDQMTKTDSWMSSPLLSWNVGIVNDLAAKKSNDFSVDHNIMAQVGSSYGGTASDLSEALDKAGKKYGLFSSNARRKANAAIELAKQKLNLMGGIADDAMDQRLSAQSMGEQAGLAYSMMTDGGYNQKYTYAAKHGGLLEWNSVVELEWQPQVELNWELPAFKDGGSVEFVEELEWIPEFKSGGKTEESDVPETEETTQKNVIPEGALHKNRHHMEHAEGLTKKGIPVVDEDGEQQAEIEHSEIIFTLEVTKKLEEYYEIFYSEDSTNKEKEQAALDAGKLLVYQILENTEDRTGLIESCKKGGSLTLKKSTDDLIEEVLEWMPTVVIVETEEVKEEKHKKEKLEELKKDSKEGIKDMIREVLIELLVK